MMTAPGTVLLVEDNATDVFVIKAVLQDCFGVEPTLQRARNGQEALLYLEELARDETASCPGLVLLDLELPKVTGIEVLEALRNNRKCAAAPVIVITTSAAGADRIAVQRLGAQAYFEKPADLAAWRELGQLILSILADGAS